MYNCQYCQSNEDVNPTQFSDFLVEPEYLCKNCNKIWQLFVDSFLKQEKDEKWVRCNIYAGPLPFLRDKSMPQPEAIEFGPGARK